MVAKIEDLALIGDGRTAALIGRDGTIAWLCWPRFDSPACMASLLGTKDNGHWRLAPTANFQTERRYRPDTLILETTFETRAGRAMLIDFMPVGTPNPSVIRTIRGLEGRVAFEFELILRFDYGRRVPWVTRRDGRALVAIAGPDLAVLHTRVKHRGEGLATVARFTVAKGREVSFSLTHGDAFAEPPAAPNIEESERATVRYWRRWTKVCNYQGPWRADVVRSLITLKALTYAPTGAIVAAVTTSIPERPRGKRNWDYRHSWLRDSAFSLLAFMIAGYSEEAKAWGKWLVQSAAGTASQLQPVYSVRGKSRIPEMELGWLKGFQGARPVQQGNDAYTQLQPDAFGEVLDALHHARTAGLSRPDADWEFQCHLLEHLESLIDKPCHGIWETRGRPKHFVHSKVMIWAAFDRAVQAVEAFGLKGPVARWRKLRRELHAEICRRGVDRRTGAFNRAYGDRHADAANLLIALVGFLPATDPRIVKTVSEIERTLTRDGLVWRYSTYRVKDGLPAGEGAFIACSFWLADNLVLQGRHREAKELFQRLLKLRNDVGLLAEEYDLRRRRQVGNFPQALSHLALIGTAYNLATESGPAHVRSGLTRP